MAYAPQDPLALRPGLAANASAYQTIWDNHNEVFLGNDRAVAEWAFAETIADGVTALPIFRWRVRGNADLWTVRTRVYAESTAGTTTLIVSCGGVSTTASVTAAGWHTLDIVPPVSGVASFELAVTIPGGATFTLTRVQCRLVAAAPGSGQLASRFTRLDTSDTYAGNEPVNTEHVGRLLAGPVRVAQTHPRCVATHVVRLALSGGAKALRNWQGYNSTSWDTIGVLRIPRVSESARPYVLDAYTMETTADASEIDIVIGGVEWQLRNLGGTTGAWHTTTLSLAPGPHDVRVVARPGASNYVRVATFQAWRARAVYP